MDNNLESVSLTKETINSYRSLLNELKSCYSKRDEQRRLIKTSSNPEWHDIEKAKELETLIMMQMGTLEPTNPDYYEAHDHAFSGLSR